MGNEKNFYCLLARPVIFPTNQFCRGLGVIRKCKEFTFPLSVTVQDMNMNSEGG
jgi:hypothetical protein